MNEQKDNNLEEDSKFEFVKETIKERPVNKKKVLKKTLFNVFSALLFGTIASVTASFLYPKLSEKFYPTPDTVPVTLPVTEEELKDEPVEEFVPPEEETAGDTSSKNDKNAVASAEEKEAVNETSDDAGDGSSDAKSDEIDTEDTSEGDEKSEIVIKQVVETIEKDLELEDYRALLRKMSAIADSAKKSIVTVSGKSNDVDWFNNSYESNSVASGLIVAENGKDLLIVAPTSILNNATTVDVTFCDDTTIPASVRKSDKNTGLSIISVPELRITEQTKEKIEIAKLGTLLSTTVGVPVVAVGSPYGPSGSVGFGQVTSDSLVVDKIDSSVKIITTDIYGSDMASGVLVNYNGRVVGIICHEKLPYDMPNLIQAYSILDISKSIEKMSNGGSMACLGIYGTDVTKEAIESHNMPEGAYVKEVVLDSPAMEGGIRNGDVITKIDDKEIKSFNDYKEEILGKNEGDIVKVEIKRPVGQTYTQITYEVTLEALK